MTIHQAKNREFESVTVLWPLKLGGRLEQKRRLLYNAVTRARGRAVVIVQDAKGKVVTGRSSWAEPEREAGESQYHVMATGKS
jgi:superfamily I DNA/RNA helicase